MNFCEKPYGRRSLARVRRHNGNIKLDLRKLECNGGSCMKPAQNCFQYRALVSSKLTLNTQLTMVKVR
jgi:hypothetical protein